MGENGGRRKFEIKHLVSGPIAIELIPDGVSVIVLFHRTDQTFQFYTTREELRNLAAWLAAELERL